LRLLLAGATGLVGGHVLEQALADHRVTRLVAPTRRPLPPHEKLLNPIVTAADLALDENWWAVDSAISALGTTRAKAGSADAFRAIDHDYPLAVARQVKARGARCFVLTSAMGANARSAFFYNRVKGDLELALSKLDFASLTLARPGLLVGKRAEHRFAENMAAVLAGVLEPVLPTALRANSASAVAALLLEAAIRSEPGTHIITAADIVRAAARSRTGKD